MNCIRSVFIALIVLSFALYAASARAERLLDQSFDPSASVRVNAGFGSVNTHQERAQTFRVGLAGTMSRLDVFVKRFGNPTGSMLVDIRATSANGKPDPAITPLGALASATIPSSAILTGSGGFVEIDLDHPLSVKPGDVLAVALHGTADGPTFGWLGDTGNPYALGTNFERETTNHNWVDEGASINGDLGFRTFVDTPEPAGLGVLGLLVSMGVRRRQR